MKLNVIKSIIFMLILIVILILLSMLFNPKNNSVEMGIHYRGASGILSEKENTIDMIVVGNSEAYASIIPMELWKEYGYTSYVCASPEQKLPVTIKILKESLKKQKPQIVMLEASNFYITSDLSDASDQILNYELKVFQYHDRWKTLKKEDFTSMPNYNTINYMKGYEYSSKEKAIDKQLLSQKESNSSFIPRTNRLYIKAVKEICENNGAKLIIVSMPSLIYWNNAIHNEIQQMCDNSGIEYLDLNMYKDEIKIDWERDTRDNGDHLNHKGAIKTTKYLGKYLNEKNILKNHKDEDQYKDWNEQFEEYKNTIENDRKNKIKNLNSNI